MIKSVVFAIGLLLATLAAMPPADTGAQEATPAATSLADLFGLGTAVRDTNDDGLADAVRARLLIPEGATAFHAAAAAEFATRLGYETAALSLPLVETGQASSGEAEIFIQIALLAELRDELEEAAPPLVEHLAPGRGAVVSLPGGRVAVVGTDGPGLHNAAAQFAGRWPNAWEIWGQETSTRLSKLEEDASAVLDASSLAGEVRLQALVYEVDPERDRSPDRVSEEERRRLEGMRYDSGEVKVALLRVELESEADVARAADAFRTLVRDHGCGERVFLLNYPGVREVIVSIAAPGAGATVSVPRFSLPARMLRRQPDPAVMRPAKPVEGEDFDLSDLYSIGGLLSDSMGDRIPDRIETVIAVGPDAGLPQVGDLAARLALECAGVGIPLAAVDPRVDQLEKIKQPILVGEGCGTAHLRETGKLRPPELAPGHGYISIVQQAFNGSNAVVVLGDREGLARALSYLAESYPGIASPDPGDLTLSELRERAEKLLAAKSAAGQLAAAVAAVAAELPVLGRRDLASLSTSVVLDKALPGYATALQSWLDEELPGVETEVTISGRRDPEEVFSERRTFIWEVDELREAIAEIILPEIREGNRVDLDIRVSEPPQVLEQLRDWLTDLLAERGADVEGSRLRLICAYKQGFHWLRDDLLPRLRGLDVGSILIRFRPLEPDLTEIRKFYPERSRWLSELYPIDEIIARELGLPLEAIVFELDPLMPRTYSVTVTGSDGEELLSEMFSPASTTRAYLERFPQWASVASPTGWVTAIVDGRTVLDRRIATDPERFWDYYQETVLGQAHDYVMERTGNEPTLDKQPFFHTLEVEVRMSEPDERIGIDEEIVSSIEALHEDIYFNTLDFFNGMVPRRGERLPEEARYTTRLGAPGSIIPIIHPDHVGRAPESLVTFLGNSATKNSVTLNWTWRDGQQDSKSIDLPQSEPSDVQLAGIIVGEEGLDACIVRAGLPDAEAIGRAAIGLQILSQGFDPGATRMLFGHTNLGEVRFQLRSEGAERTLTFPCGDGEPAPPLPQPAAPGEPIVPLDHIIGPDEAAELTRRLGTLPGVTAFRSGTSYQGRDVYSLEILPPTESALVSRAKLIIARPTILIIGRQHANEVSSTSHILRLAELLATDPRFETYRLRLNIILHPMENPDGAALAERLIGVNRLHMNHAARYTALGAELGTQHDNPDTLLTEALARPMLWNRWLPDIFLNCHGYPSHEWVQPFSGYSPYQFRDYWIPRGWFVYVTHLDDPRSPEHRRAGRAILGYIDRQMTAAPEMAEANERIYNRYWRWAGRWQPHIVNYELHGDTMIYSDRRSSTPRRPSPRTAVTAIEGVPEQMDETAQDEWLRVVVAQGLSYLEAHLRYLVEAESEVEALEEESGGRVLRRLYRRRPVVPPQEPEEQ